MTVVVNVNGLSSVTPPPTPGTKFSFESLDVYRRALDFVVLAVPLMDDLPRGQAQLSDQLRRAAVSITLNIAESTGRRSKRDAMRHLAIARGSAMECAAVMDVFRALGFCSGEKYNEARGLLLRVVQMLSKMSG